METALQASNLQGIGRNTAYDLIHCGQIRSVRIGHQIRVPKDALLQFLHVADN
ncbi:excisionase family DNA-binding protein [Oscillibacter valericigenes]|nr:excisionase family DNA-binding protein [Oscillibacter valericigenes]